MEQIRASRSWLIIVLLPVLLVGCGKTLPATVTGIVTLDGQSLPEGPRVTGSVIFYPVSSGAASYGTVTSDGKYSMKTGGTQGLKPGEYRVTVRVVDIDPPPTGGYNNAPASKMLTPSRYQDRELTDLKVTVIQEKNEIDLKLSSS